MEVNPELTSTGGKNSFLSLTSENNEPIKLHKSRAIRLLINDRLAQKFSNDRERRIMQISKFSKREKKHDIVSSFLFNVTQIKLHVVCKAN